MVEGTKFISKELYDKLQEEEPGSYSVQAVAFALREHYVAKRLNRTETPNGWYLWERTNIV